MHKIRKYLKIKSVYRVYTKILYSITNNELNHPIH